MTNPNDIIPLGLCQCGCGQPTNLVTRNDPHRGDRKGEPCRYLPSHHKLKSLEMFRVDPATGCHVWLRALNDDGYGLIRDGGKNRPAHAVFWERTHGPIPQGFVPHHTCENKSCVNVAHLELKTRAEHAALHNQKVTQEQITQIGQLKETMSQRQIARHIGIPRRTVRFYLEH